MLGEDCQRTLSLIFMSERRSRRMLVNHRQSEHGPVVNNGHARMYTNLFYVCLL